MSEEETIKVLDHHVAALLAGDVDGVMEDYHDDAKLITNLGVVVSGTPAIRNLFASLPIDLAGFEVTYQHIEDSFALVAWKTATIPFAADTFTLRDGKIVIQTAAVHTD